MKKPTPIKENPELFYVIDPDKKGEVGYERIQEKDGQRFVMLTASQAAFWLDQGTISRKAPEDLKPKAANVLEQAQGIDPAEQTDAAPKRKSR